MKFSLALEDADAHEAPVVWRRQYRRTEPTWKPDNSQALGEISYRRAANVSVYPQIKAWRLAKSVISINELIRSLRIMRIL
jgi:hypothetical protein